MPARWPVGSHRTEAAGGGGGRALVQRFVSRTLRLARPVLRHGPAALELGSRARRQLPPNERAVLAPAHHKALVRRDRDAGRAKPRAAEHTHVGRPHLDAVQLCCHLTAKLARPAQRILLERLRDGVSLVCAPSDAGGAGGAVSATRGSSVHGGEHLLGEPHATLLRRLGFIFVIVLVCQQSRMLRSLLVAAVHEIFIEVLVVERRPTASSFLLRRAASGRLPLLARRPPRRHRIGTSIFCALVWCRGRLSGK